MLRTEIARHVFEGGALNVEGTDTPSGLVREEGQSCEAFRVLLGNKPAGPALGNFQIQLLSQC